ncbi:3-phosphoshikimate 1-carboxyvinyltransferase [Fictibacillus macauensis ZFHKF-1]|uniref:3-phosphoshikimate 1-carboxyvinyltransferase n=1 Tax=Fictibacillus macauensis ZFHKF-1 TaxID=1196324 RepID=I8ALJ3_9BACL|nr:3-phosphoshikimate 1-carboxyvinyltransferase [Fictibacillus macauensis]EIT86782.1 3-phosphoshikimate 1-carboxyvinyltransferase [Fictibacillus macauensis ZFHKF-1]
MKKLQSVNGLNGEIPIPGDKSISHRSVMFGAIANGTTNVTGFLPGDDCLSTIACFKKLGVDIKQHEDSVIIEGKGIDGLVEPTEVLDVGNSGTTIRLMLGILTNTPFHSVLIGDHSIGKRPMQRVTKPLQAMGAAIEGRAEANFIPLSIRGGQAEGMAYTSPVASAQVKSAILLGGLQASGTTTVTEPHKSRDHTERMLKAFGVDVQVDGNTVSIRGGQSLRATAIEVPGDISSAAFFLVAGSIVPNSSLHLKKVGLNPTRTGILDVLHNMGACLEQLTVHGEEAEPFADLTVKTAALQATEVSGELIPRLIDEIPIIALAATQATGTTVIKDAAELKVKETNRIDTVVQELSKMGANIEATEDGMIIHGPTPLHGANVDSHGDHRIGMMLAVAASIAQGETILANSEAVTVSYPKFFAELERLTQN